MRAEKFADSKQLQNHSR